MLGNYPGCRGVVATLLIVVGILICCFIRQMVNYDKKMERERQVDDFREDA